MNVEKNTMIFQTIGIVIVFIVLIYFAFWMARKSWEIYDSLHKIEKRVSQAKSKIEIEECVIEIENLNLFHPSHHEELEKIKAMIKIKMQYLN